MRDYELVMLVNPRVADEEVPAVVEKVTQFVTAHGGAVSGVKPWGRRRLAYHVGTFQEATYVQANFTMDPLHSRELEHDLIISEEVIRHLLVRFEPPRSRAAPSSGKKAVEGR